MPENSTLSISVLSGKGGVGKTNLALNLGYALHAGGSKVLLMDCDFGLANLDVLLGITPERHMQALVDAGVSPDQLAVPIEKDGFDLLPANSGMAEFTDLESSLPSLLAGKVEDFARRYDYLFLDIGAGISPTALAFGALTHMRLVVITPEPTSLTDSYALIKVLSSRYKIRDFFVVVNQAENAKEEAATFKRLAAACSHFLNIHPIHLGSVREDHNLPEAVRRQSPLFKSFPDSPASWDFVKIADKLKSLRREMLPRISEVSPLQNR